MTLQGKLLLTFFAVAIVVGVVGAIIGIVMANRAMGDHYARVAEQVRAQLAAEGLVFEERGLDLRVTGRAALAVSVSWLKADLVVTRVAVYVFQWRSLWGKRMHQPTLALSPRGVRLNPEIARLAIPIVLEDRPTLEGDRVCLSGRGPHSNLTLTLRSPCPPALAQALGAR